MLITLEELRENWEGSIPGLEDPQEEEMATYSSIPAWEIPWTEEAGGLQPPMDRGGWWATALGSQRVGHG